jgi:hypothetical protein
VKITFLCGSGERLGEDLKLRNFEEELVGTFCEYKKIILNVGEYVHEPKPFRAYLLVLLLGLEVYKRENLYFLRF